MFEIGTTELLMIAVVALLVIGPKDLPRVARRVGEWVGKLRRYVDDVKADINRQVELDELRNLRDQVKDAAQTIESSVRGTAGELRSEFDGIASSVRGDALAEPQTQPTDWDRVYALRRQRQKYKDRRIEREREFGVRRRQITRR